MIYDEIKAICKDRGVSVSEIERQANLGRGTISKWNTVSPTVENLSAVADVLKVKIQRLIIRKG